METDAFILTALKNYVKYLVESLRKIHFCSFETYQLIYCTQVSHCRQTGDLSMESRQLAPSTQIESGYQTR